MKITEENKKFLDDLFSNVLAEQDLDLIDLHDSDACDDHIQFQLNHVQDSNGNGSNSSVNSDNEDRVQSNDPQ